MPASGTWSMNRRLLGAAGMALNEDDYAKVVAALGAVWTSWTTVGSPANTYVGWWADRFFESRRSLGPKLPPGALDGLKQQWEKDWRGPSGGRVPVRMERHTAGGPDLLDVVRVLQHPAVRASSVFIDWPCVESDLRWQWPMRVGALADDFEDLALDTLKGMWPAKNLVSPLEVTRENARVEVLVMRAGVKSALSRLLSLQYKVRAGFLMLVAPCDVRVRTIQPHAEAMLAETQAGGFALVQLPEKSSAADALNSWSREISHNTPLDFALAEVIDRARSLVALDMKLIHTAALPVQAKMIGERLMALPQSASLGDLEKTGSRLGRAWTMSKPPAEVGREIVEMASTGTLPVGAEDSSGSALSELGAAEREAERAVAVDEPARYLQGRVFRRSHGEEVRERRGLVVGERYALDLFIGEEDVEAMRADVPFPDEQLPWEEGESLTLQVLFAEPQQWNEPMQGTLELQRAGTSSICRFVFAPTTAGAFAGRVTVYYRGRILQTALLETTVVGDESKLPAEVSGPREMRLRVEAEFRRSLRTLNERRRFDACIVCNHTTARKAALTAAGKDGAYIASLGTTGAAVSKINELLTQVAHDSKSYAAGLTATANAKLLYDLALQGNALYRNIVLDYIDRSSSAAQIRSAEYLQIVTMTPDAIVPLEFVYEYPLSASGAPVCANAENALKNGECPRSCRPTKSPAPHVCPLGFWGLSKVIERHIHVPDLPKAAKVLGGKRGEPIAGRDTLSLSGSTLIGMSKEVPSEKRAALDKKVRAIRGAQVESVKDWQDWQSKVGKKAPIMLVALPHASGAAANISLEIGGNTILSALIDRSYVHPDQTPPPLALLLGCDTATTIRTDAYLKHVEVFRQADAALVLGTVATVLGADAPDMAEEILQQLVDAVKKKPARFGEVLRESKRAAVGKSRMVALSLVAFGDADWRMVV